MTTPTDIEPALLPPAVRACLAAHAARDAEAALRTFTRTAVVVDDGTSFRGPDEILDFLRHVGTEFHWTAEMLGAQRVADERWVVQHRLEGDFPGGVVELDYHFALDGDLIAELVIAPR